LLKLAVINDEVSQELDIAIALAQEFYFDGLELRSLWDKGLPQLSDDDIEEIRDMMDDAGLEVACLASPFFKSHIDSEEEYKQHLDILRRCIDITHKLDTNLIRGFGFWREGAENYKIDDILARYKEPKKILEGEGVYLVIENEHDTLLCNAKTLREFLDRIDSPNIKGLWDPGNEIFDPDGITPFPDAYNLLKDQILHIHLKNAKEIDGKMEACPLDEGKADIKAHLKGLIDDGYEGYVSLETHYRKKKAISSELLKSPTGSQFSMGGEEATYESAQILVSMLAELTEEEV